MSPLAGLRSFLSSVTEMSSARGYQPDTSYPTVPSTLNPHGNYEMREYDAEINKIQPNTLPFYTPYLGLRARLSQVWFNRWTILLLLIIARLLIAVGDIKYSVGRAKEEALQACTSVENVGSAMASMPHYLSAGVNALAADGVTKAINALMTMLMLTVTGVEEIILFVINMMTSTYVCLITLAVSGSLHAAIDMIEKVGDFMNKTIGDVTKGITSDVASFESSVNSFLSKINIPSLFGSDDNDPPKLDISDKVNALNNIKIDTDKLDADLLKLNNSIPTFEQVHNFTNTVIRFPFELVKQAMNESLVGYRFDESVFDVAPKQALTFCSDNTAINDFFDALFKVINKTRLIFLIVLIILAVAVCIPVIYRELWRWKHLQSRSKLLQRDAFDPMDVIYLASRPYSTTVGMKLSSHFATTKRQILARWFVAYCTSTAALFVLSLGMAGLLSCLCQYIILRVLEGQVPKLASEVGEFAGNVVGALNNASTAWAVSANDVVTNTNDKINKDVFGWVDTSTTAVNDTLNKFTEGMASELNSTFGGTILYEPITGVLNCLIGLKIAGFQKAITWVHDNAHIDFPKFRPDVFSLGAIASLDGNSSSTDSFLASPGSVAGDDITNAVMKVSNKLQKQILQETIISSVVVGVWVLVMLIGLVRVLVALLGRDKTRAEGGPVGYTGDQRGELTPRSPNRNNAVFPAFGAPVSSVEGSGVGEAWGTGAVLDEKVKRTGHRSVESQPGHERQSSYGLVEEKR